MVASSCYWYCRIVIAIVIVIVIVIVLFLGIVCVY